MQAAETWGFKAPSHNWNWIYEVGEHDKANGRAREYE
jgi:hypothetical protein